jgi:formamidopyrimidine-DNA glycosylase
MPELPEVETIRKQLDQVLPGKVVKGIEILREKSFSGEAKTIIGRRVSDVKRKAKIMVMEFEDGEKCLMIHLKMTGQLIYLSKKRRIVGGHPTLDWVSKLPSKHTRVVITFVGGDRLFFNDMRVFGWIRLVDKIEADLIFQKLPPDVLEKMFTEKYLHEVLETKKAVKLVIMDQEKIGGIGNIYANDALYKAKIRPDRAGNSLTRLEVTRLHEAIKRVIGLGIKSGGASAESYFDINGMGGSYQDHFLVYKKDDQECEECGEKIVKTKLGGRGTFYCPKCQK